MKILFVNGSPQGDDSICAVMFSALTKRIQGKCEIVKLNLAGKSLQYCRGCYSCWTSGSGCVIDDDFNGIIRSAAHTDIIVFASPVYFSNVSGLFKNFLDRLTSTGSPHSAVEVGAPKFIMISNCGYADYSEFEILSLWIKKFVRRMNSELLGEYYFPNGKRLRDPLDKEAADYLDALSLEGEKLLAL